MRVLWVAVFGLAVLALPGGAEGQSGAVDPAKLVGIWDVVKAVQPGSAGSTLEFKRDGTVESAVKGTANFTGKYRVQGNVLFLDPPGIPVILRELTATKLVIDGTSGPVEYRRKAAGGAGMPKAVRRSGGFTLGAQPRGAGGGAAATGGWQVVTSKEDGYTVEMPGKPGGEESGSGGGFSIHIVSYRTFEPGSLELLVAAVEGPTEIPEAEKAKALGNIRDQAVHTFGRNPQVVSEKPVRLGSLDGFEFELTLEAHSKATVRAWGRSFAVGKKAYVLMANSGTTNGARPAGVTRFLDSFSLTDRPAATMKAMTKGARRDARPPTNPAAEWGQPVDPDGDVSIAPADHSMTMTIPGTPHVLAPERGKMNAPRVVAPARGDFVVTVQVDGPFKPAPKSTVKGLSSRQAGGLILWKDPGNYLVFQRRATVGDEDNETNQAVLEELVGGHKGVTHRQPAIEGPIFLRLERRKGRISAAFSGDGKTWKDLKPVDTTWAEGELQVGVVAVSTSPEPHSVTFNGYTLKAR